MLWAQRSFQNHHQTFHDRCPEKIGPLPKKSDQWFTRTCPENMGLAPTCLHLIGQATHVWRQSACPYKDKMVVRLSHLYKFGNSYASKPFLYWDGPLTEILSALLWNCIGAKRKQWADWFDLTRWRPNWNVRALVNTGSRLLRGAYREKWRRQNGVASASDRSANYTKICS